MATTGKSASQDGDKLLTHNVAPAWPQSIEKLDFGFGPDPLPGLGDGDLLIRQGFLRQGDTASEEV